MDATCSTDTREIICIIFGRKYSVLYKKGVKSKERIYMINLDTRKNWNLEIQQFL